MNKKENFISQCNITEEKLIIEKQLINNGGSTIPLKHIENVLTEIDKMKNNMSPEIFIPYYPRGIVESWDFNNKLGSDLLELASLYMKL